MKRHISVPLSPHIFGAQSGEWAPTVAVGGVQLGRYHSYHCTNQKEFSSALSWDLCSHRCLCHSNIIILLSSFSFRMPSEKEMREGFHGNHPGHLLCSILSIYSMVSPRSWPGLGWAWGVAVLCALSFSFRPGAQFDVWPQASPQKQPSACAHGHSSQMELLETNQIA